MQSFDQLDYGATLTYVGPDSFDGEFVSPPDYQLPFTFQHVSLHGTVSFLTRFNGRKRYAPAHPANDPAHWEVVDDE
jgi:hypothetical protein